MNKISAFARTGPARVLAVAAILAASASAAEPPLLGAQELAGAPLAGVRQELPPPPNLKAQRATLDLGADSVEAIDLERLDRERGRADTVLNDTRLNGDVANNSAVNVSTGSNTIDAGSFANMSGIPVVIQNSGANVLIQNATVVNLQFQ